MGLIYKQLFREMIKDKIFLSLLFLLTVLTSISFFFVMFSIDGNMDALNSLSKLTENQEQYKIALTSNRILAYIFFLSLTGLTSFVFILFFYRFFRANKKQLGAIKALGFKDSILQFFFVGAVAVLSLGGSLSGMLGGYFLSDVLLSANSQTYGLVGLVKGVEIPTIIIGITFSGTIFCLMAGLCYGFIRNKEAGVLLAGNNEQVSYPLTLRIADKISRIAPEDKRLSLRIALRKPFSVLLLVVAVMSFMVCIILGQSLHVSSAKIMESQTEGHDYEYDIQYLQYQTADIPNHVMAYVESTGNFSIAHYELERRITGLYHINDLYKLQNKEGELLAVPKEGRIYINPEFSEIYGVKIGDTLTASVGGEEHTFRVEEIAVNAGSQNIYVNGEELAKILNLTAGAYNGVLSENKVDGDIVTSKAQRIEELNRNLVSNKVSAVINQATGILVGAVLIFLALYINFQDNTHDILILSMLGYPIRNIRKLLVNVYLPVLWIGFIFTLIPGILLARAIQNSLSVSTNDYMPFGVNVPVVIIAFLLINLIYLGVQAAFNLGIKRVIDKGEIEDILEDILSAYGVKYR